MKHVLAKSSILLAASILLLALTACDGGDSSANGDSRTISVSGSPRPIVDDGRFFTIDEVGFGPEGYVSLTNFTEVGGSLATLFLCQPPKCVALPDVTVAPGDTAVVAVGGGEALEGVVATEAGLDLSPRGGEVGLYGSRKVDESLDLRAYVEWGSTPHEGTPTAVEAGLWLEGSFVESSESATRVYRTKSGEWELDIA